MFKPTLTASAAALALAASVSPATAQQLAFAAPAQLTCSDIAELEAAHAAALVYYIAGWTDAEAAPAQVAPPAVPEITEDPMAPDATQPAMERPVGGLTLSAAAVIQMCIAQPDALISDIIEIQGGSGVLDAMQALVAPAPVAPEPMEPEPMEPEPMEPEPVEPEPVEPEPVDPAADPAPAQ